MDEDGNGDPHVEVEEETTMAVSVESVDDIRNDETHADEDEDEVEE